VLGALLVFGGLSTSWGVARCCSAAVLPQAVAMLISQTAASVSELIVARIVQGIPQARRWGRPAPACST